MKAKLWTDGGARGNPGPAAAAAVVSAPDGRVLEEAAVTLGHATNNVAEYRGLLLGLERAAALGATEVEVVNAAADDRGALHLAAGPAGVDE